MKHHLVIAVFAVLLASCDRTSSPNPDSDILGIWDFVEYTIDDNGDVFSGLYSNSGDGVVYHFEKPSSTGYMWVEIFENGIIKSTTNTYEYEIVGDSLKLKNTPRDANGALSSHYEIMSLKNGEMTLSWYSEYPSKHERTTVLMVRR